MTGPVRTPDEMLLIVAKVWMVDPSQERPSFEAVALSLGITDTRTVRNALRFAMRWLHRMPGEPIEEGPPAPVQILAA